MTIDKVADVQTYTQVGQVITYTFTVTNTGNQTLFNLNVSDPLPGLSAISCPGGNPIASLAPGASVQCTATYTITQADIDTGSVTNVASVTTDGGKVSASFVVLACNGYLGRLEPRAPRLGLAALGRPSLGEPFAQAAVEHRHLPGAEVAEHEPAARGAAQRRGCTVSHPAGRATRRSGASPAL